MSNLFNENKQRSRREDRFKMYREVIETEESKLILLNEMIEFLKSQGLWEKFQEESTVKVVSKKTKG